MVELPFSFLTLCLEDRAAVLDSLEDLSWHCELLGGKLS